MAGVYCPKDGKPLAGPGTIWRCSQGHQWVWTFFDGDAGLWELSERVPEDKYPLPPKDVMDALLENARAAINGEL